MQIVKSKIDYPTFTTDVALGIVRLINTEGHGICQRASNGSAARHEFAKEILRSSVFNNIIGSISFGGLNEPAIKPVHFILFNLINRLAIVGRRIAA